MRIAIGSDHTGFELKQALCRRLGEAGRDVVDFGTHSSESIDYPDIAAPLARAVVDGRYQLGIVICSNGVGVSIAANKVAGARAALCADPWSARRARQHTDANILALGAWSLGRAVAEEIVDAFVDSEFEGGRHVRRLAKIGAIEREERDAADDAPQEPSEEPSPDHSAARAGR